MPMREIGSNLRVQYSNRNVSLCDPATTFQHLFTAAPVNPGAEFFLAVFRLGCPLPAHGKE